MARRLTDLLKKQFPTAAFDPNDPNLRLGSFAEWDSLGHFNLLMLIEQECQVQFTMRELAELKSLAEIEAALRRKGLAV